MTELERVAKAIYDKSDEKFNIFKEKEFEKLKLGPAKKYFYQLAKAAIREIRNDGS